MKAIRFLAATALTGVALTSQGAYAQAQQQAGASANCEADPSAAGCAPVSADGGQSTATITVTGSRIGRPNLESTVPITSISGESFFQSGQNNIGDELNELPQLRSTFAQTNPGLGIGIAGLNLLDLRGLGTSRTLVLVNGRRHVPADILNNAVSPDINTIPNDLIERVDIVTGGNSAVYGSDAIAGVVNFVLRRDFSGFQVRTQAGITQDGFGGNQYISAMAGHNYNEGRGNITVHAEYARSDRVFGSDVSAFRQQDALAVTDVDQAGLTNGSDGIPDRIFVRDLRSASINRFGLIPITQSSTIAAPTAADPTARIANPAAACGVGIATGVAGNANLPTAYNCTFLFNSAGVLSAQTGTRFGQGIIGSIVGGNGQTGREDQLLSILPKQERYNINLLAHYSFSDAIEAFVEAKATRIDTRGSNAGPSFIQGTFGQFDVRERIRLDNPFLGTANRATIANAILASGCNTSLTVACNTGTSQARSTTSQRDPATGAIIYTQGTGGPLNAADIAQINAGTYRFVTSRNLADSGIRDEQFRRTTYRVVAGLRGTFNDDWKYELSANYGKFNETTTTYGYVDRQRFVLSLDAGLNPATGRIQCRSQYDPAAAQALIPPGFVFSDTVVARNRAKLAADIAACVPYNPFGSADNSAAARYYVYNATSRAQLSQFVASGFVSGDLSQLFELPGGPVGFAIGAEYRREKARYDQDPYIQADLTNAVNIPTFAPPVFRVKEAYGELRVPILKDVPFFRELTLSGAGRVADYSGPTGTVYSYNGGIDYAPIRDVRFRANYGRSVRAPNVSETAFPLVPNFAPGFLDPCASGQIAGNPNRQTNCTTDLGALLAVLPNTTYSLNVISGSNPNLQAEKSDSYTVGAVVQPHFIPNLSISVDYYDIKVNKVIVSLSAQQIANLCYDQPSLQNQFCALFTRYRGTGPGPLGEQPGQILGNSLIQAGVNFAKRTRRGIDTNIAYRTTFGDFGVATNLIYTHNLAISNYNNPALPDFENRVLEELGDPKDEFRWDVDLSSGPVTFGYRMRYIGPMYVNTYEDFNALQGRAPENADYSEPQKYKEVFYHDLRVEFNLKSAGFINDARFYLGVDNLLDTQPPLGSTATGAGSAIYDFRGRNFYAGIRTRF